eukprot:3937315-Karenia_brevis.AAC.1
MWRRNSIRPKFVADWSLGSLGSGVKYKFFAVVTSLQRIRAYLHEWGMDRLLDEWRMLYFQSREVAGRLLSDPDGAAKDMELRRLELCPLFELFMSESLPQDATFSAADCMKVCYDNLMPCKRDRGRIQTQNCRASYNVGDAHQGPRYSPVESIRKTYKTDFNESYGRANRAH